MQEFGALVIDDQLVGFAEKSLLPDLGISRETFWAELEKIITRFAPQNRQLVAHREVLQKQIDDWHVANRDKPHDAAAYKSFLQDIGYLQPEPDDFEISTSNVDAEIAHIAGAQLVVPVSNARFALNAANARWGSLYDALYGTDAISGDGEIGRASCRQRVLRLV